MTKEENLPDDFRCRRTDGRDWRCKRRVLDGKKLCEIHYLQGRRRQLKQKVPESLKLERKKREGKTPENGVKIGVGGSSRSSKIQRMAMVKKRKRCISEALDEALRKMKLKRGDLQLELIREFLKRQVEKKKKKKEEESEMCVEAQVTRVLPNGVMAISKKKLDNAGRGDEAVDVKIGPGPASGSGFYQLRGFRSKNIEPLPISTMQVVPFADKLRRRKRCHWCRMDNDRNLVKCLKCRKQFFCTKCIKQRYFEKQELKVACPVCLGTCSCRICERRQSRATSHKDFYRDKRKVEKIQLLHYLIHMVLPVLKQLNQCQSIELELESIIAGKAPSEIQIQQTEISSNKSQCCNNCKASILDYYRSCENCSYSLCLSCCWEFCRGSFVGNLKFRGSDEMKSYLCSDELRLKIKQISTYSRSLNKKSVQSPISLKNWEACSDGSICCPPADFGGCSERILDLRCMFPVSWMKELEVGAEEVLRSSYSAETSDVSSCCSLCKGTDNKAGEIEIKLLQKMAKRIDSSDNFLYCPTITDLQEQRLEHFQQHWAKGHPVIVRNVFGSTSVLNWDPVVMFCTYLEKKSQDQKEAIRETTCLDWFEVETATKRIYMGSLAEDTHVNIRHQIMKIKAWLSSHLFQEQFPSHYAEILRALPLQEYMNPIFGLLNLALKLPQETSKPEIGPCIHISYGGSEDFMKADFLTKLCYDSYDVVNILVYATDAPISTEQFDKIRGLMKKYKARDHMQSSSNFIDPKGKSSLHSEESEESGSQERLPLLNGISKVPSYTSDLKGSNSCFENGNMLDSESDSEFGSEASLLCSGNLQRSEDTDDECFFRDDLESSISSDEKQMVDSCAAQWDIFRREDAPKVLEYLRRHSDEFNAAYCYRGHEVHPIHDQNFFLDAIHKMRLKEEFDVQPWTFDQRPGEAIVIPAGCPYQIRKLKSCVNVVLDIISPENAAECIRLTDEIRLLPICHKARAKVLEVRKMAVHGINAAVEEIQNLMSKETAGRLME